MGLAGLLGAGGFAGGVGVLDNARRELTVMVPNAEGPAEAGPSTAPRGGRREDRKDRPAPDERPGAFAL